MKMIVIAVHCDTSGRTRGFRIMDKDTGDIIDQPSENVKAVLQKGLTIEGLMLEHGQIKGSNGSLDRYTKLCNNRVYCNNIGYVILKTLDDVGFVVADYNGNQARIKKEELIYNIDTSPDFKIANGKIVTGPNGKFLSSISGTYDNEHIEVREQKLKENRVANVEVAKKTTEELAKDKTKKLIQMSYNKIAGTQCDLKLLKQMDENIGMSVEDKVIYMEYAIKMTRPFYYYMLTSLDKRFTTEVETMAVSIGRFYINPNFVMELSLPEIVFVGLHEICHIAMMHPFRHLKYPNNQYWSTAVDMFVNEHLIDEFKVPRDGTPVPIKIKNNEGNLVDTKHLIALPQTAITNPNVNLKVDTVESLVKELEDADKKQQQQQQKQNNQGNQGNSQNQQNNQGNQGNQDNEGQQNNQGQQQSGQGQQSQQDSQSQQNNGNNQNGQRSQQDGQQGQQSSGQGQQQSGQGQQGSQQQSSGNNGEQGNNNNSGGWDSLNDLRNESSNQSNSENNQNGNNENTSGRPSCNKQKAPNNQQSNQGSGSQANHNEKDSITNTDKQNIGDTLSKNSDDKPSSNNIQNGETQDGADTNKGKRNSMQGKMFRGEEIQAGFGDDIVEDDTTPATKEAAKQAQQAVLARALTKAKKYVKSFGSDQEAYMERLVADVIAPKVNWVALLKNKLTLASQKINTFAAPDKRFRSRGMVMPGPKSMENDKLENVKICIDTSGSISNEDIGMALAQIKQLLSVYKAKAELLYWDTRVRAIYPFEDIKDLIDKKPMGGGGTDANCIFDYFETNRDYKIGKKKKPEIIIVFTDGYFKPLDSKYKKYKDTIWIINNGNLEFKAPFGKVAPFKYED